jgi:uncharacterized protein YndB with AHSA1/START domain
MTTLNFSVHINAQKEKVWEVLWSDAGYRRWTSVFSEGSYAESDWEEGSNIRFLSPTGDGMFGVIQKKVPFDEMVFEHRGEIKNGLEENKDWAGALEGYYLKENGNTTGLRVQLDIMEEYADYFSDTFPKALEMMKQLAEKQ